MAPETIIAILRPVLAGLMPELERLVQDTRSPVDDMSLRVLKAVLGLP
jgi:hypothetical protein